MVDAKIATSEDFQRLEPVFKAHCERMKLQWSNFGPVSEKILSHTDFGLVVVAENIDKTALGFMMFTYEWSDWRDGLFFWV